MVTRLRWLPIPRAARGRLGAVGAVAVALGIAAHARSVSGIPAAPFDIHSTMYAIRSQGPENELERRRYPLYPRPGEAVLEFSHIRGRDSSRAGRVRHRISVRARGTQCAIDLITHEQWSRAIEVAGAEVGLRPDELAIVRLPRSPMLDQWIAHPGPEDGSLLAGGAAYEWSVRLKWALLPFGTALIALWAAVGTVSYAVGVRSELRRFNGRCTRCGYMLDSAKVCPECGLPCG